MSEELKPNDEVIFAWWDDEYDVGCYSKHGDERYTPKVARKYVPADLLPVVKPLVWVEHCAQTGGCHSVSVYNPKLWGYVIEAPEPEGPFGLWSPDEGEGVDNPRLGLDYPTIEAAQAAAQADYEARIRASLDMIDPAALVAGAYEAAADELAQMAQSEEEIDNPHDAELIGFMARHVKTLTPADAQAALDAAIAKAVNAKLTEVHCKVRSMVTSDMGVDSLVRWSLEQVADTILEMKEPE